MTRDEDGRSGRPRFNCESCAVGDQMTPVRASTITSDSGTPNNQSRIGMMCSCAIVPV